MSYLLERSGDLSLSEHVRLQAVVDLLETIDALAEDQEADLQNRKFALELQVQNSISIRFHLSGLIKALTEAVNSEKCDPIDHAQYKALLTHVSEKLRERGPDISHWVEAGSSRLQ